MRIDLSGFRYMAHASFWKRLWDEINVDNCWGMAAQLSYYFLLAFFPFVIFVSALIGFLPLEEGFVMRLMAGLSEFMPADSFQFVDRILNDLLESKAQGLLTLGILSALWCGSLAFNGMISLMNQAYGIRETRSYLKTRSLAILVTLVFCAFLIISSFLLFFGDHLISIWIQTPGFRLLYLAVRWILIFLFLTVAVQFVFYSLPAKRIYWRWISPGGVLTVTGWIFGSLIFRSYVNHFGDFKLLWGSLGALIALMVWFYICSFCLVLGSEIDSEIYKWKQESLAT